jgi:hypothetical protein
MIFGLWAATDGCWHRDSSILQYWSTGTCWEDPGRQASLAPKKIICSSVSTENWLELEAVRDNTISRIVARDVSGMKRGRTWRAFRLVYPLMIFKTMTGEQGHISRSVPETPIDYVQLSDIR